MITKMYYDQFAGEYTLETQPTAPPERYLKVFRGNTTYKEKWRVGRLGCSPPSLYFEALYLDVAYTELEVEYYQVVQLRLSLAKKNNVELFSMDSWTIPAVKFDEYVRRYGLNYRALIEK